jgi:hypothetical protein
MVADGLALFDIFSFNALNLNGVDKIMEKLRNVGIEFVFVG